MSDTGFNVLMVCSGNLCRSPIAEQLLRARVDGELIRVSSAGTIAGRDESMPGEAAGISSRYGGNPDGHRSRPLTDAILRNSDLVLTATRAHRATVVQLLPRMTRTTFTLNEFARLVGGLTTSHRDGLRTPASVVDAARSLRGFVTPPELSEEDDLEDPYRRSVEVYEAVGTRIHECIAVISSALGGAETG